MDIFVLLQQSAWELLYSVMIIICFAGERYPTTNGAMTVDVFSQNHVFLNFPNPTTSETILFKEEMIYGSVIYVISLYDLVGSFDHKNFTFFIPWIFGSYKLSDNIWI